MNIRFNFWEIRKEREKQLAEGLSNLASACYNVAESMHNSREEMNFLGFSAEDVSRAFGFTNYFYQRECFKLLERGMPKSFDSVMKSIELVCKACEKHMNNPFE